MYVRKPHLSEKYKFNFVVLPVSILDKRKQNSSLFLNKYATSVGLNLMNFGFYERIYNR